MWDPIQNLLPKVAGKYNFTRSFNAIKICQEYRKLVPQFLPADVLKNTFPKSYTKQTLVIGVINSAWAQQIQMHKHPIQEAINQKYGVNTLKNLRIEVIDQMPPKEVLDNKNSIAIH